MSRITLSVALVALAAGLAAHPLHAQTVSDLLKQPPGGGDPVVARVDDTDIHRTDVISTLQSMPPQVQQMQVAQIYPLLLEKMIDGKLLATAARSQHLEADPDVTRKVAQYQERTLQEAYLNRSMNERLTDDVLKQRYQQFVKDNPPQDEVHARHILVASEAEARSIITDLKKPGADFAAIAKAKSTDGSARQGGDLGYFTKGDMVPEFSTAAFALKPGQVTQEPVKTQFGWHVIKVEDRRTQPVPSFDDSKEQLRTDAGQEIATQVVDDLKGKAKIERFGLDGKPLPAQ